ncbi:MAG: encapsulin [Candidatus Omnitrophica bacterium]|nr:encapsulin [Candidatus Omnitrophota bacterium]
MAGGQPLTEQQMTYYDQVIQDVIRQEIVGRNLIALAPGSPFGFGVQKIDFNTLVDMSDAELSMKLTENTDMIGLTNDTLPIPILHKEWEIDRRDLASSNRTGMPLDTLGPETAASKVAALEDSLILNGWTPDGTNYDINGLYQGAGGDYSTSKDFGTAGNAITAVKGSIAILLAAHIKPPYNLTLNQAQYAEILGPRATTSDKTEMEIVKDMLRGGAGNNDSTPFGPQPGGNIFVTNVMTAGTGLVSAAPNPRYADLAIGTDIASEYELLPKSKNSFGRVFECLIPRIKVDDAFCKLSDI